MYNTIPQIFAKVVKQYPAYTVQMSKDAQGVFQSISYSELLSEVNSLSAALSQRGVKRGDLVGLISDNRSEWLASDLAILTLGAADVPRGRDAMPYEVSFILSVTEASFCFVENAVQLRKILNLLDKLPKLKHLIVMDRAFDQEMLASVQKPEDVEIILYNQLIGEGRKLLDDQTVVKKIEAEREKGKADEIATIIFTSGTTDRKSVV